MKKTAIFALTLLFSVSLAACGSGDNKTSLPKEGVIEKSKGASSETENQQTQPSSGGEKTGSGSKILIAYFTVPETDDVDTVAGASRVAEDGEVLGNTEFIAKEIQKNLGGDLFVIETEQKYPGEHQELLDLPMPLYTFFETYDFAGKTIIPFVTHGGSGFSDTINTIRKLEPDAEVINEGLSVSRNNVANAQADVKEWTDALLKE